MCHWCVTQSGWVPAAHLRDPSLLLRFTQDWIRMTSILLSFRAKQGIPAARLRDPSLHLRFTQDWIRDDNMNHVTSPVTRATGAF